MAVAMEPVRCSNDLAVVLVATGVAYRRFLPGLIRELRTRFTSRPKRIVVISDSAEIDDADHFLLVEHLPVPLPSLLRYHWICRLAPLLSACEYTFYLDVDVEVRRPIGDEILHPLVAVRHWRWPTREQTPRAAFERRRESRAYVDAATAHGYFQASLQGGRSERYLEAARVLRDRINEDFRDGGKGRGGTIARWYDESHWNRYVNEYVDEFAILGPEYAQGGPEGSLAPWLLAPDPYVRMLDKDDAQLWRWRTEDARQTGT